MYYFSNNYTKKSLLNSLLYPCLILIVGIFVSIVLSVGHILLVILLGVLFLFFALIKPYWCFQLFLLLIPVEGVLKENYSSIIKIIGGIVMLGFIFSIFTRRIKLGNIRAALPLSIFMGVGFSSIFWSIDIDYSIDRLITYVLLSVTYIIFLTYIDDIKKIKQAFISILIGSIPVIISGILELISSMNGGITSFYLSGLLGNYNYYFIMFLFLFPAFYILFNNRSITIKVFGLLISITFFCTALFTKSRAGLISLIVLMLILIIFKKNEFSIYLVTLALGYLIYIITPSAYWERFLLIGKETFIDRILDLWPAGINAFFKKPIFGYGLGANVIIISQLFPNLISIVESPHNGFLAVAMDTGIVGLIPFLFFSFSSYFYLIKFHLTKKIFLKTRKFLLNLLVVLIASATTMYIAVFKGGGMETSKLFWLTISFLGAYSNILSRLERNNLKQSIQ